MKTETVRTALRSFGAGGQEIHQSQLYDALGLTAEPEKARVRRRIADLLRHGEVTRVRDGVFIYNEKHRPREAKALVAIWRFVRKAKPGWSVNDCALMTKVSYTRVLRYCTWLEEHGFVARVGKNERNAVTYRGTLKADQQPETPYPPQKDTDPFARERVAAASITRLMLCADPYAPKTAREISEACNILLDRFGKNCTENENVNNTEDV